MIHNTTRYFARLTIGMVLTGLVAASTPVAAFPCLDENEWFCDPDPQADLDPELGQCAVECRTETYRVPGPGDDITNPNVWLFQCRANVGGFFVPVVLVGTSPDCPAGWDQGDGVPPTRLLAEGNVVSSDGTDLVTVVTGECPVTWELTVYGSGLERHTSYVPCAHVA